MRNDLKKVKHSSSWNKHRNKKQTRELSKKIRCQITKEIKTLAYVEADQDTIYTVK